MSDAKKVIGALPSWTNKTYKEASGDAKKRCNTTDGIQSFVVNDSGKYFIVEKTGVNPIAYELEWFYNNQNLTKRSRTVAFEKHLSFIKVSNKKKKTTFMGKTKISPIADSHFNFTPIAVTTTPAASKFLSKKLNLK